MDLARACFHLIQDHSESALTDTQWRLQDGKREGKGERAYGMSSPAGELDEGLEVAAEQGWTVVDRKKDWKVINPHTTGTAGKQAEQDLSVPLMPTLPPETVHP